MWGEGRHNNNNMENSSATRPPTEKSQLQTKTDAAAAALRKKDAKDQVCCSVCSVRTGTRENWARRRCKDTCLSAGSGAVPVLSLDQSPWRLPDAFYIKCGCGTVLRKQKWSARRCSCERNVTVAANWQELSLQQQQGLQALSLTILQEYKRVYQLERRGCTDDMIFDVHKR